MKQLNYLNEIEGLIRMMYGLSWPLNTSLYHANQYLNMDLRDQSVTYIMGYGI